MLHHHALNSFEGSRAQAASSRGNFVPKDEQVTYCARARHPLEPGHETSQVPGGHHSSDATPNEALPCLLGRQLYQLPVPKAHTCSKAAELVDNSDR